MEPIPLTILGAGSIRCGTALIGSLASYYGERPLEVRLYDADEERLDLFDRLARLVFDDTSVEHGVRAMSDPAEALEGAQLVVLAIDDHGARKYLRRTGREAPIDDTEARRLAIEGILCSIPEDALLLSLLPTEVSVSLPTYYRVDWPPPVDEEYRRGIPFQILRWLHREEPFFNLIDEHERSPLKKWLDDPSSAQPMIGTRGE